MGKDAVMRPGCLVSRWLIALLALIGSSAMAVGALAAPPSLDVMPPRVELVGNFARAQLLVSRQALEAKVVGRNDDLTPQAAYASSDSAVVTVSAGGQLLSIG